ncbi:MAG: hypothetical protein WCJ21_03895 [Planctomycetota bacterium]
MTASPQPHLRILLVSADLLGMSQFAGLATRLPATVETLASPAGQPRGEAFDLLVLDLAIPRPAATLVAEARTLLETHQNATGPSARLLAYGPHVARERLEEARRAGADLVVSRGQIFGDLPGVVASLWPDRLAGHSPAITGGPA